MDCPVCSGVKLLMSDRQGIEIDYCPQCRGVWLDRGELDKIIDRSTSNAAPGRTEPAAAAYAPSPPPGSPHQQPYGQHHDPRYAGGYYKKKKREGFLSEIFDFD